MSTFSDRLKELRGTESQSSFAAQIELNRVQYAKYESGVNAPSIEVLTRICRVHACSADWLLGLKNDVPSIAAGKGSAIAIGGNASVVNGAPSTPGESAECRKCPYRKKLEKLEKLLSK